MYSDPEPGYFSEGFLAIQRAADLSIIGELGGTSSAQRIDVELKTTYLDDNFCHETALVAAFQYCAELYWNSGGDLQRRHSRKGK